MKILDWASKFNKYKAWVSFNNKLIEPFSFPSDDMLLPEDFTYEWFLQPHSLEIDLGITQGCTDSCWFCNYGRNEVVKPINLEYDFVSKIIDKFTVNGGKSVAFTHLGEAFYHGDFHKIVDLVKKNNLRIKNITNGTMLLNASNKIIETYSQCDHLRFSIDAVDDRSRSIMHHTGVTTGKTILGIYDKYIDGLNKLIQFQRKNKIRKNRIIGATILISPFVLEKEGALLRTIATLKQLGLDYVKIRPILNEGRLACNLNLFDKSHTQRLSAQLPEIMALSDKNFWVKLSDFSSPDVVKELTSFKNKVNEPIKKEKCWISIIRPHIDPNTTSSATVYPCLRATWEHSGKLFNVRQLDSATIQTAFNMGHHKMLKECDSCCNEFINKSAVIMERYVKKYGKGVKFVSLKGS